jgi:Protein of unknown function (DUF3014)
MALAKPLWDPVSMTDGPADIELAGPPSPDPDIPPRQSPAPVAALVAAGVLVFALTAAYLFLWREPGGTQAPVSTSKPQQAAAQPKETGEQITLPPLDETDPLVRQLVEKLSTHPMVAAWLTTDGLILNFVVVTSRIANGDTPVAELKAVGPIPPFRTRTAGDDVYLDRSNYSRYDRHAAAVSAIDARGAARLYATLEPRITDAYARLGPRDSKFDPVLERAIVELLEVPVVEGEIALEPHGIVYAFADPRLQGLTASQKQLLRMGPQNVRIVQAKLREIAGHLGIPASRLPSPAK